MISRPQQILLKRAQAQACIDDEEYRQSLEMLSGLPACRSSKDARLTDRHVDNILSYFETIYWNRVSRAELVHQHSPKAVFQKPGYWAGKNPKNNTSRDRYTTSNLASQIQAVEQELMQDHGCGLAYLQAIQNKIVPFESFKYLAALTRTVESKRRKLLQTP